MAVAMFMHWPGMTSDQYDAVMARLGLDANPAAGGVLHVAALTDEGLEMCDVWQTEQAFHGFLEQRMLPVVSELGIGWPFRLASSGLSSNVSRCDGPTEILEGRGFPGPDGLDYIELDLTHLGADRINHRLPLIREVCMKFLGLDPILAPIPIRPVAHYSMGGIEADINGRTKIENIWAAGEVACHSLHGANRLGCNSTAECLAWGGITGGEIAKYLGANPKLQNSPEAAAREEEARLFKCLLQGNGGENPYKIRRELREIMDRDAAVFRDGKSMREGIAKIGELRDRR